MTLSKIQSKNYFIYGCIPARLLLAFSPYYIPKDKHTLLALLFLLISLAFAILYTFDLRKNAPEGGGKTWWNKYRLFHALTYLLAAVTLLKQDNKMLPTGILITDTLLGAIVFYQHRFS